MSGKAAILAGVCGVGLLFVTAWNAYAHHAFGAEFDPNRPVLLKGPVVRVEWINPHTWIHLDVKTPKGTVERWMIEGGPPNALYRAGWRKDSLKVGDALTVNGYLARDGSKLANMRNAIFPDGREVFGGQQYYSPTVPKPKGH